MRTRPMLLLLLGLASCAGLARGQTLEQVQQEAQASNPAVAAAEQAWHASEERVVQEGWWPNPRLKLSLLNLPAGDLAFDRTPMSGKQIMVTQRAPFWRAPLKAARARARARAAYQAWQDQRWQVRQEVTRGYHDLAYLQRAETILKKNLGLLQRLVKVARVKYERGAGLEQDVLRAEVESTLLENQLLEIGQKLDSGRAKLNALLGRPPDDRLVIESRDDWQARPLEAEVLRRRGRENNARLKLLEALAESARLSRRLADADWIPDLELSGYYTAREVVSGDPLEGEGFVGAAIGIEVPLWFFSHELPAAREAKARWEGAEKALEDWRGRLDAEVSDSHAKLERLAASADLYARKVLPQAKATLDSSLTAYQTGRVEFLTLISNETMLVMHELDYYRILAEYESEIGRLEALTSTAL